MTEKRPVSRWHRVFALEMLFGVTLSVQCVGAVLLGDSDFWASARWLIWIAFGILWAVHLCFLKLALSSPDSRISGVLRVNRWWVLYDVVAIALYAFLILRRNG